jgi:hypothetical protein
MLLVGISGLVMRLLWRVYNTCGFRGGVRTGMGMGNTEMEEQWGEMGAQLLAVHQSHQPRRGIMFSLLNTQMSLMLCVHFEPGVKDQCSNPPTCLRHDLASGSRFDRREKRKIHLNGTVSKPRIFVLVRSRTAIGGFCTETSPKGGRRLGVEWSGY